MMLEKVSETLESFGFKTFPVKKVKSTCFNLLGVKGLTILFIKALKNIDSISKEHARDLKMISSFFNGCPLIIGEKNRRGELGPSVIYEKANINAINLETLRKMLQGEKPIAYADKGGLYVSLDGENLKKARKEKNMTLGELSDIIGVSRSTIYKYEQNDQGATLITAQKLEEELKSSILKPLNPIERPKSGKINEKNEEEKDFSNFNKFQAAVFSKLNNLGFIVRETRKAPFDALSKRKSFLIMTGINKIESPIVDKKAKIISHITDATDTNAMFVVEKKKNEKIDHVPILNKEDLKNIRDTDELREELEEKKYNSKKN